MMVEAVVIGVSAGGMEALSEIIPALPEDIGIPVIVVQHMREDSDDYMARHLDQKSAMRVKEAEGGESILPGVCYIAPAGYHLLIEDDRTFALSKEAPVNYARPSIDVLFESAAEVYEGGLIGVILTGANSDGAQGLATINVVGGMTMAQTPETAVAPAMPRAAIQATTVDHILDLPEIASRIISLAGSATGE
jgi:two-component system, chemotaxis family, protein-glutamate methylesterase/glutaminase